MKIYKLAHVLFISNFIIFFVGAGLLPVLPLYATQFGATATVVGFYLAFTYLIAAALVMVAARLLALLPRERNSHARAPGASRFSWRHCSAA